MLTLADALEALTNIRPLATTVITEAVIDFVPGDSRVHCLSPFPARKTDGMTTLEKHFGAGLLLL